MKKNITINLFGSLYAIDNDAYDLLEEYLENMKRYFSKRDGGDEIADDIEHRVAELLAEMKANGLEAISIENVQEIIHRIGNPEDMDEGNESVSEDRDYEETPPNPPHFDTPHDNEKGSHRKAKLFRDPDDKMLGGVISGICKYFGGWDPLPLRIIMIILLYVPITGIFYLIAWALIPVARTTEEKLQMCGKPVNPQTLNEELMRSAKNTRDYVKSQNFATKSRSFLDTILHILIFCIKLIVLFFVGLFSLCALSFTFFLAYISFGGLDMCTQIGMLDEDFKVFMEILPTLWIDLWGIAISIIIFLGIILFILLRSLIKSPTDKSMSKGSRITLALIAILSLAGCIAFSVLTAMHMEYAEHLYNVQQNTINGIYVNAYDRRYLDEKGWNIITCSNCNEDGDFCTNTPSFTKEYENDLFIHFEKGDKKSPMSIQMERSKYLPKGFYHLESICSAPEYGAFVYVKSNHLKTISLPIPADAPDKTGNMKHMTPEQLLQTSFFNLPLSDERWKNNIPERIKGWSFVRSESFYHEGGNLTYGSTTLPTVAGVAEGNDHLQWYQLRGLEIVADSTALPDKNL